MWSFRLFFLSYTTGNY